MSKFVTGVEAGNVGANSLGYHREATKSFTNPLAGLILMLVTLLSVTPAQAQFATGGSGIYRNNILWFDWGTAPSSVSNFGATITNNLTVAEQTLAVTCSLGSISGSGPDPDLQIYRPGTYFEDGLDNLYNIGGIGTNNTMDIGLLNRTTAQNASFTYSCSATLGGAPYTIDGLVFADAETTSQNELTRLTLPEQAQPCG